MRFEIPHGDKLLPGTEHIKYFFNFNFHFKEFKISYLSFIKIPMVLCQLVREPLGCCIYSGKMVL
jgi:hypothetical protein